VFFAAGIVIVIGHALVAWLLGRRRAKAR
jgi:hypothetical protein